MALIAELKRRRVFRVAGVYAATAWIVAEASSVVVPALLLSERIITVVVVLLILGFPFALILAWIFDIEPGGVQRTASSPEVVATLTTGRARIVYGGLLVGATLLLAALGYWRFGGEPPRRDSVAVLPFANLSGDASREFFSDGISEELLNLLARVPGLKVAARTSSFALKGQGLDVREIGQRLDVATVLEGSVRWSTDGDRVRITAQLIDAASGFHLWSDTYDRDLTGIFAVQDDIATSIVARLRTELDTSQDMVLTMGPPTADVEAYTYYLQGRALWKQRGEAPIRRSIELFQKAVARDPGFARAHSNLAAAYVRLPLYSYESADEFFDRASEAALVALTIDGNLAEAHAVLADISRSQWAWTDAESGFFFATSLDGDESTARHWYSVLLRSVGRRGAALTQAEVARQLDPHSPVILGNLALCLALNGRYEEALAAVRRASVLGLSDGWWLESTLLLKQGDFAAVRRQLDTLGEVDEGLKQQVAMSVGLLDPGGGEGLGEGDSAALLADPEPQLRFLFQLMAGDLDGAYDSAALLVPRQGLPMDELWWPAAGAFRQDPRFPALMADAGLVDYWRRFGWAEGCQPAADNRVHCD